MEGRLKGYLRGIFNIVAAIYGLKVSSGLDNIQNYPNILNACLSAYLLWPMDT